MGLASQGDYNDFGVFSNALNCTVMLFGKVFFFLSIVYNDLGLKVQTQVLRDGSLYLVGVDFRGIE